MYIEIDCRERDDLCHALESVSQWLLRLPIIEVRKARISLDICSEKGLIRFKSLPGLYPDTIKISQKDGFSLAQYDLSYGPNKFGAKGLGMLLGENE